MQHVLVFCANTTQNGAIEALSHNLLVTQVASSLNSSHIPTRRLVLEILSFLIYYNDGIAFQLVITALENVSTANDGHGYYDYWFRSLEQTLSGRGKMGSLVGASDEVKTTGGTDVSLNEYAVCLL